MTVAFSIGDALRWTKGTLLGGDEETILSGISIDSRTIERGQLFHVIAGPSHDGHDFLEKALDRGAAALIVERGRALPDALAVPVIAVEDTTRALGALAAGHRSEFHGPVVAITGSNGKTTTKEMCAAILSVSAPCHRTPGNLNNQYGLPLTLLGRSEADRALVVELGMNQRGEIAQLAETVGQPVLVPGDMGRSSYVLVGQPGSMEHTFGSSCHGAGRRMSRRAAIRASKGRSIKKELLDRGVIARARGRTGLEEEQPDAYKDVLQVVDVLHKAGISRRVAKLRPVGVIKG